MLFEVREIIYTSYSLSLNSQVVTTSYHEVWCSGVALVRVVGWYAMVREVE